MLCNAIYHKGWTAVTRSTPWMFNAQLPEFDDDVWELYDTNTDWTQAHDLATEMPDKLAALQRLFLIEAVKYDVLPLDDRRVERFNSELAGRPTLIHGNSQIVYGGMGRLSENSVINLKNKSHSVTAEVTVPDGGGRGVIIAQGGAFAGWSVYLHDGNPTYLQPRRAPDVQVGRSSISSGTRKCAWSSPATAEGSPREARSRCIRHQSRRGRVDATVPMICSGDKPVTSVKTPAPSQRRLPPKATSTARALVQLDIGTDNPSSSPRRAAPRRHDPPIATQNSATEVPLWG
jgi:arylsulfatase